MFIDINIAICDDYEELIDHDMDVMVECAIDTDEIAFIWRNPGNTICIELKSGKSIVSDYDYCELRKILKEHKNKC